MKDFQKKIKSWKNFGDEYQEISEMHVTTAQQDRDQIMLPVQPLWSSSSRSFASMTFFKLGNELQKTYFLSKSQKRIY